MESTDLNIFTKAALTAVLVNNDFHYMHFLSSGKDFDKSHNLAQEYYDKIDDEVDYLMELALEVQAPVYNYTVAGQMLPEYQPESKPSYDYPTLIECLKNKIAEYITVLKELRNSTSDDSIQSRLDDMVRDWEKELNYRLERRTEKPIILRGFINTGFDDRMSRIYGAQNTEY